MSECDAKDPDTSFVPSAADRNRASRAELIDVLAQGERHVDELSAEIGQSVANTFHLRVLANVGLVTTRRDGTRIYYRLASARVPDLRAALRDVAAAHHEQLDELAAKVKDLPAGVEVVAYCRGPHCVFADDAVRFLRRRGRAARRIEDGFPEWQRAELPIERAVS